MKRILFFILVVVTSACQKESNIKPGDADTFVRYFNGGNNDYAETVQQTPDGGFIMLATTQIKTSELSPVVYKIKLIKTDPFGNIEWQQMYPSFDNAQDGTVSDNNGTINYSAHSLTILSDGGYVLVGEDIQKGTANTKGISKLLILKTDAKGTVVTKKTFYAKDVPSLLAGDTSSLSVVGKGITQTPENNYLVLASTTNANNNMVLGEVNKDNLSLIWNHASGAGDVNLSNRLFLDGQNNAVWSGTVSRTSSPSKIRFVRTPLNSAANGAPDIGDPSFSQVGNDICSFGQWYAVVGSTDEKFDDHGVSTGASGTTDILYKLIVAETGQEIASKTFPIAELKDLNAVGNSIAATQDGGLIILGTVISNAAYGRGDTDYYLIKIDAAGTVQWRQIYGSKFADVGASIIQVSDGSYVAYGTTQLGGIRTLMMMKTDRLGNIR